MTDKKKKKGVAVIISIGPKMKTKPTDAATPDMKKYGSMPMKKAWNVLKYEGNFFPASFGFQNARPSIPFHRTPQQFIDDGLHRKGAKNYTRDSMPPPSRYDDEGFEEYDMRDMGPPYGKPEFGDEDARQAEMNEAERAAIMAEGMPEMRKPRGAPRPGDPRLRGSRRSDAPPNSEGYPPYFNSNVEYSAHNQPRPRMPKDVFANR